MTTLEYIVLYWKPLMWSLLFSIFGCLTNYLFILPLNGIYLIIYILIISTLTICLSFKILQNFLLQQNRPINFHDYYNYFNRKDNDDNNYYNKTKSITNTSCIQQLSCDIDRYFVKKWFINISNDEIFDKECRTLCEEILQKLLTVELSLDKQAIIYSILNLYLKHLKEFRRSLRRKEKYGGNISELYRYSHMCCNDSNKAKSYFLHQLTINLLNHFINWELSNSLPYRILVSIISRKVILYLLNLLSNPEFLNYYLLMAICSKTQQQQLELNKYRRIQLKNINIATNLLIDESINIDEKQEIKETKVDEEKIQDVPTTIPTNNGNDKINKIETDSVRIYEAKSCKTWYDSYDLESVTLGQDILDMIDDSDKDTDVTADGAKEEISPVSPVKSLFDEVKHMTTSIEGIKTISDVTLHNIKDFQESTVNNVVKPVSQATSSALHKIGGLHLQDEAAGVMEGLLDFGRTKIRKGLRLTGLQDDISDEQSQQQQQQQQQQSSHKRIVKMPHVKSQEKSDDIETTWMNPLQEELLNNNELDDRKIPSILTESHDDGSPEPEYEETADLATSIAKLRSLLEQKSSESSMSTPAVSPIFRPQEDFSNRILSDTDEVDGVMPSFYKFCAKTATGVINNTLNTIKTALPGNVSEHDRYDNDEKWLFIEGPTSEHDLFARMEKLLNERKVFCTVDTAYEAIDSLLPLEEQNKNNSNIQFKDELDDFEVTLPVTKALLDILTELLADRKDTLVTQEPVIKSVLLLFGNLIEDNVIRKVDSYINYWCTNANIPEETNSETLHLEFETFIETIYNNLPDYVKYTIGEDVIKHLLKLLISSLQIKRMNQDVFMQIFEIISIKLMDGSKNLSSISA